MVGSGPNGLVAANVLADAGWTVAVVEAEREPGGAVRTAELTLPGFRHDVFSAFYPLATASPAIARLGLERFGLRWCHAPSPLAHPLPDGRCASIHPDADATAEALSSFDPADGPAWAEMLREWDALAGPFLSLLLGPFPPLRAAASLAGRLKVLGTLRAARSALLPVRRLAEERFAGEGGRILLGGCALHADLSPESAGSGLYGWLLCCLAQRVGFPVPAGGAGSLSAAMASRLESRGGKVLCGARVAEILVRRGRAVGVRLADGGDLLARRAVVADVAAPQLFHRLVGEQHLPSGFVTDLERFHWDAATVKVDWALERPVPWTAAEARTAATIHVADDFANLTEHSAQLAMGLLPSRPFLVFGQQSVADPSRSPPGTATAWAYTHVPREVLGDGGGRLGTGPVEGWLPGFVERVEERIESLAPGFRDNILARHCLGPRGLEDRDANLDLGAIGGGTAQLHQQLVFRPVPGFGRPETPVAGLYLASASAHPGPGVHGSAGANAARAALLGFRRLRAATLGRGFG